MAVELAEGAIRIPPCPVEMIDVVPSTIMAMFEVPVVVEFTSISMALLSATL